jgi:hypothetical protein
MDRSLQDLPSIHRNLRVILDPAMKFVTSMQAAGRMKNSQAANGKKMQGAQGEEAPVRGGALFVREGPAHSGPGGWA